MNAIFVRRAVSAVGLVCASFASAQQASIVLLNSNQALCNHDNTSWSISKDGAADAQNHVIWTVTVTRGVTTPVELQVNGYMDVKNGGSAPATIGNIVVNLQKQMTLGKKSYWVSAAADIADATNGDGATTANIVASASQEDPTKNPFGANNYSVSSPRGTFVETAGSGSLLFTDVAGNAAFSLVPQVSIPGGATVRLLFVAKYNLNIPEGTSLRTEAIVTFGNAGARGGSGATANNIDVNGDTLLDSNVRSVPTRLTSPVPAVEHCNDEVLLTDPTPVTVGDVIFSNYDNTAIPIGPIGHGWSAGEFHTYEVSGDVTVGADGGSVTNTAFIDSDNQYVNVPVGIDPVTGLPVYYSVLCCEGVHYSAAKTIVFEGVGFTGWNGGDYFTYRLSEWRNNGSKGDILKNNYVNVFPTGLTIGDAAGFTASYDPTALGLTRLQGTTGSGGHNALLWNVGGAPGALTANALNAPSTSAGDLAANLAVLTINVSFNDYNVTGLLGGNLNPTEQFGNLHYINPGDSMSGMRIRDILAAANLAASGGGLPVGYTFASLNTLVDNLNNSFQNGSAPGWSQLYLRP